MKEENLLISKVAQGDKNALNEIYTLHSRKVYNMILNRFNDKSLADDITQEVFITVYEKSINFRGDSQVSTWIFRIAINKCLDELKRKKKINDHILKESFQTIEYEDDSEK
jgi:RNA polymerase sigma factor (sigma-70 family)